MKSFKILVCIVLLCTLFSGCMNQTNLKDLAVIEGIGIDNEDDQVKLTVQSLNSNTSSGAEKPIGNMTINTTGEGSTIVDAVDNLTMAMSKELFFGHNKIIVFSKEVCETDFQKKLDYFLRSSDSRADVAVCMADGKASTVLENTENDSHVPVENIVYLINNGQKNGHTICVKTKELLNAYNDKTTDVYIPVIKEREDKDTVELKGIAVFNNDKLSYILNEDETLGFMLMTGKVKNCIIELEDEKLGKIGVEISSAKAKKAVSIVNGGVQFDTNICGSLIINEIEKGVVNTLGKEDLDKICKMAEEKMLSLCQKAFVACQSHNSDSIRVGEYLAKDSPKSYELLSDDWDSYFKSVTFSGEAKVKLKKISDNTQLD
ncbi:MAG: Ger(x)C family spore germination protein [Clostridium sp.]|nr:Ger(x)C family spore germination protein [Clostridium sp.]